MIGTVSPNVGAYSVAYIKKNKRSVSSTVRTKQKPFPSNINQFSVPTIDQVVTYE